MKNVSNKICRESLNTNFTLFFFFENRVIYEIMWKMFTDWGRPEMTIWRMRIARWILKGYKNTLGTCNNSCFFHGNISCTTAPQCYIIRALGLLLIL